MLLTENEMQSSYMAKYSRQKRSRKEWKLLAIFVYLLKSCRKGKDANQGNRLNVFFSPKFFQTRSLMRVMLGEKGKWEPGEEDCETDHIFSDV